MVVYSANQRAYQRRPNQSERQKLALYDVIWLRLISVIGQSIKLISLRHEIV